MTYSEISTVESTFSSISRMDEHL